MGYDAVLPGEADFFGGILLLRGHEKKGVPFVCLNLVSAQTGNPVFSPYRRFSRGGVTVLVTGLASGSVFPKGELAGLGLKVLPPGEALPSLFARQEGEADVVIVLSHLGFSEDRELARRAGRPLIILGAHSRMPVWMTEAGSDSILSIPQDRGRVLQEISVGSVAGAPGKGPAGFADGSLAAQYEAKRSELSARGKEMDRRERDLAERTLTAYGRLLAVPEGKRLITPRAQPLDETVPDDPEMVRMHGEYRKTLGQLARTRRPGPAGPTEYRGHAACGRCHPENHAGWRKEPHAVAHGTLAGQGDGANPDCLPCHVTGYGKGGYRTGGPKGLEGVGCEACHGPGKGHPGKKMTIPGEPVCRSCHEGLGPFPFAEKRRLLGCVRAKDG